MRKHSDPNLLSKLSKCKTMAQAMKLFDYKSVNLKHDADLGFELLHCAWTVVSRDWEMRFSACRTQDDQINPVLHAVGVKDPSTYYLLFKGNSHLPNFNFPLDKKQLPQWVCAGFDSQDHRFRNMMFVGSFQETLKEFVAIDKRKLESSYAKLVVGLDPNNLSKLRTRLQDTMLDEIDEAEQQHNFVVANIRNRYRNQLNYFTALFDEAQDVIDAKHKATYAFQLDGYPPSKMYTSYKACRRAHSRRNLPNVECLIHRFASKHDIRFARWSVEDRVWIIFRD